MTPPEERAAKRAARDAERAERERERELREMDRATRSVFAYNLSLKAEEKELFALFSQAGPLSDIKIIRDKHTGRSKGFAYIEYEKREDVIAALSLSGQVVLGQPVMVKMSEAEKNLAWEAAEQQKLQQKKLDEDIAAGRLPAGTTLASLAGIGAAAEVPSGPCRVRVANVHPSIAVGDLRPIFEPFGPVDYIEMEPNAVGKATVQYKLTADAEKAAESLEGMDLVGQRLSLSVMQPEAPPAPAMPPVPAVDPATIMRMMAAAGVPGMLPGMALPGAPPAVPGMTAPGGGIPGVVTAASLAAVAAAAAAPVGPEVEERIATEAEDGGGLRLTAQSRAALMSKLAANAGIDTSKVPQLPTLQQVAPGARVAEALAMEQGVLGPASPIPTPCLLLKNMFSPEEESAQGWDSEIADDVKEECSKYGEVFHVYVDPVSKGFVYLMFSSTEAAAAAKQALHGRWFAGRQVVADFQFAAPYKTHFGC